MVAAGRAMGIKFAQALLLQAALGDAVSPNGGIEKNSIAESGARSSFASKSIPRGTFAIEPEGELYEEAPHVVAVRSGSTSAPLLRTETRRNEVSADRASSTVESESRDAPTQQISAESANGLVEVEEKGVLSQPSAASADDLSEPRERNFPPHTTQTELAFNSSEVDSRTTTMSRTLAETAHDEQEPLEQKVPTQQSLTHTETGSLLDLEIDALLNGTSESDFGPADVLYKAMDMTMGLAGMIPEDYPFGCVCDDQGKCKDDSTQAVCPARAGTHSRAWRTATPPTASAIASVFVMLTRIIFSSMFV